MGVRLKRQFDERVRGAFADVSAGKKAIRPGIGGDRVVEEPISAKQIQLRFGDRVREVRQKKGISQEALADLCELHRTFIGSVERGERNVSLVNIYRIARGLGVSSKDLMPDVLAEMPLSAPPNQKRRAGGGLNRTGSIPH